MPLIKVFPDEAEFLIMVKNDLVELELRKAILWTLPTVWLEIKPILLVVSEVLIHIVKLIVSAEVGS
tara:strand:- start:79 stop:279 length:201 start_codon:yes stop_codon:yes gene_type:complete